jgi:hypothetical protein
MLLKYDAFGAQCAPVAYTCNVVRPNLSQDLMIEMVTAIGQLDKIRLLQENWDGMGAAAIDSRAGDMALMQLKGILQATPTPDVIPNPNGTISLAWETEQGRADLEIGKTKATFILKPKIGEPKIGEGLSTELQGAFSGLVASFLYPDSNAFPSTPPTAYLEKANTTTNAGDNPPVPSISVSRTTIG